MLRVDDHRRIKDAANGINDSLDGEVLEQRRAQRQSCSYSVGPLSWWILDIEGQQSHERYLGVQGEAGRSRRNEKVLGTQQ